MAIVRRRNFAPVMRARGSRALRPVEWIRDCEADVNIGGPLAIGVVLVEAAEFDDFTAPTVVRMRGHWFAYINDITLSDRAVLVYGITLVNPGEPSPSPMAQRRGNRWLYWGCDLLVQQGVAVDVEDNVSSLRREFDIKAMRRRTVDGSNLQFCFEVDQAFTPGGAVAVSTSVSTLVKE